VQGRFDEAVTEIERAHASDPLSLVTDADVGYILHLAGRDEEALVRLQKTLGLDPSFAPAHFFVSQVYRSLGRDREAFEAMMRKARSSMARPRSPRTAGPSPRRGGWVGAGAGSTWRSAIR
jgi:tetratricopeptide (TPR) repeat protein